MTLKERVFGREADTPEMVVYKNYTIKEWFIGRHNDRTLQILTATQRIVGIVGIVILVFFCGWMRGM
jgi:hypothetical protein